jgi:7-cyano-7-deazaguanine synthase in queuosine biosynthesis|tara:strand:- start:1712 stop:2347 length:636 start_codon:yes stop_codon:yes gene_type:complete
MMTVFTFSLVKDIPLDKRIAVMVSGGWDSAVMWYMVKTVCMQRNQECNAFTVPKIDGAEHYANKVLEWSSKTLGHRQTETTIVGDISSTNPSDYVTSGAYEIFERDLADHLFTAVNKYPPNQRDMLDEGYPMPNDRFQKPESGFEKLSQPFANFTKDTIVQLGFDLGIAGAISPITHSCTELNRGRCNSCWWCKEREWAFKQINKTDTGEN